MDTSAEVVLRHGLAAPDGTRHRRALLRPPAGRQELALAGLSGGTADPRTVSSVLAACVERIGGYAPVTAEHTAALTRGDRSRIALELRSLLAGDALLLTLRCPAAGCGQAADLRLRTAELTGVSTAAEPQRRAVDTPAGTLWLRPPTGADDEACADADADPEERAALLWGRLVCAADGAPVGPDGWRALDPETRQLLAAALAGGDPLLDLAFVSPCPQCRAWIELELDPFAVLVRSLHAGEGRLLAEVHCLAFHYGWSEAEILGLARPRRLAYLDLIRRQLEGRPLADVWS